MIDVLIDTNAWFERDTIKQIRNLMRLNKNTMTNWMNFFREVSMCA